MPYLRHLVVCGHPQVSGKGGSLCVSFSKAHHCSTAAAARTHAVVFVLRTPFTFHCSGPSQSSHCSCALIVTELILVVVFRHNRVQYLLQNLTSMIHTLRM